MLIPIRNSSSHSIHSIINVDISANQHIPKSVSVRIKTIFEAIKFQPTGNAQMRLMQLKHLTAEIIKINSNCPSCLETTDGSDEKGESIPIPAKAYSSIWMSLNGHQMVKELNSRLRPNVHSMQTLAFQDRAPIYTRQWVYGDQECNQYILMETKGESDWTLNIYMTLTCWVIECYMETLARLSILQTDHTLANVDLFKDLDKCTRRCQWTGINGKRRLPNLITDNRSHFNTNYFCEVPCQTDIPVFIYEKLINRNTDVTSL